MHSFSFSIRDVACCSVSNQIFAHLTDNRATGSNNNNHFAQVQCIRQKWLFTRRSSERVFFFFFFLVRLTQDFPRKMSVVLLSSEILLPHSFGHLPFAVFYLCSLSFFRLCWFAGFLEHLILRCVVVVVDTFPSTMRMPRQPKPFSGERFSWLN